MGIVREDDSYWDKYKVDKHEENVNEEKESVKNTELVSQLMKYTSNLDVNKMQGQVEQLSKAVTAIQEMVSQFKRHRKIISPKRIHLNGSKTEVTFNGSTKYPVFKSKSKVSDLCAI